MKKCPICGRKVVSKRRDAIYCRNPRCRKEAFLARKEQAALDPLPGGKNKASVVVAFPDGSRWLMELTPLQPTAQTQLPTLTQVESLVQSQTEKSDEAQTFEIDLPPATVDNSLEQFQSPVSDAVGDVAVIESESASAATIEETKVAQNGLEQI